MTRDAWITGAFTLATAFVPYLVDAAIRRRLRCQSCGTRAPALPDPTLERMGWSALGLRILCPSCMPAPSVTDVEEAEITGPKRTAARGQNEKCGFPGSGQK